MHGEYPLYPVRPINSNVASSDGIMNTHLIRPINSNVASSVANRFSFINSYNNILKINKISFFFNIF
ncbi:hypothetical protein DDB_G0288423 [Dictyostelium discoideum AX4]|uniref:hypothetical protein n=1 Tax=Dictyostelium discoideum AX4 TaxID=352472 RepID=UPI00004E3955|nr:hypothetical protein DDB_G0288423 [Dictyostelium discoideum AX4]EAL63237.1 hypothetical protein DDB_G0288423 [Dictyostelium discoideum AX4]|eukprot:XP_636744.1 hypothetical protein DDB_G0288423 [Dictyostelium discoideum AX4]